MRDAVILYLPVCQHISQPTTHNPQLTIHNPYQSTSSPSTVHSLSTFVPSDLPIPDEPPNYWYTGCCPQTGMSVKLPRTRLVEAIAQGLMHQLAQDSRYGVEGKMYGVLLVESMSGEKGVLKAFSGLLHGKREVEGWVPPIPGREQIRLEEAQTLKQLAAIKQELIAWQQIPERSHYATGAREFELQLQQLAERHSQRKRERQRQRQHLLATLTGEALTVALESLADQSRRDGMERRDLKRQRDRILQPLKQAIDRADGRIADLKHQRREASRQLLAKMYAHYRLTNFAGLSLPLNQLTSGMGVPTGTGACCAPKLLHHAATHQLKPLAMAEFWWGPPDISGNKVQGEFYGACAERCQPLMGFLLSGLFAEGEPPGRGEQSAPATLMVTTPVAVKPTVTMGRVTIPVVHIPSVACIPIVYEDEWLIAVDKPAGLLSVPGRSCDRQDSALNRLRSLLADGTNLMAVHRLDQDTSGMLLFARTLQTYRQLSQQFQAWQVRKVYEAKVAGIVAPERGVIELPLWGDPGDRPYQTVDYQRGKPSITHFQVLAREANFTRLEFIPQTGRTHQIRVHAADVRGLGIPILGDRLYGNESTISRLHLHARELWFEHPQFKQRLHLKTETPF